MYAFPSSARTHVQTASGLNLLAGMWLIASGVAAHAHAPMLTNNVLCGVVVCVLAAPRVCGAYDQGWLSRVNAVTGLWVVVAPWAVMGPRTVGGIVTSNLVTGGLVTALGCWSAGATRLAADTVTIRPSVDR
jgi:hypothetical protein